MHKPLILTADATVAGGSNPPRPEADYQWEHHGSLHSRVLEVDPVLNKTTTYWYDNNTREQFVTDTWHDITPIVEYAKAHYNATDENARMTPRRDGGEVTWTHTAHVPIALAMEVWKQTGYGKDREAVSRWHKDPENRHFLMRPVRLGV